MLFLFEMYLSSNPIRMFKSRIIGREALYNAWEREVA
jgi:hypothetical protein